MATADDRLYAAHSKKLATFIAARGMRKTQERFSILEEVCRLKGHFSAETLREAMEAKAYHVSLTSIYNTLDVLMQAGILTCHTFGGVKREYELQGTAHIHLVCTQCGKIREVVDADLAKQISLRRYGSFAANSFSIDIFGICASCARTNRKNMNKKNNPHDNGKS